MWASKYWTHRNWSTKYWHRHATSPVPPGPGTQAASGGEGPGGDSEQTSPARVLKGAGRGWGGVLRFDPTFFDEREKKRKQLALELKTAEELEAMEALLREADDEDEALLMLAVIMDQHLEI